MARITFEYDPDSPDNIEVDIDISDEEILDSATLIEILATGVDSVAVSCWETNDDREQATLNVAKLLLLANDARRGNDDVDL